MRKRRKKWYIFAQLVIGFGKCIMKLYDISNLEGVLISVLTRINKSS